MFLISRRSFSDDCENSVLEKACNNAKFLIRIAINRTLYQIQLVGWFTWRDSPFFFLSFFFREEGRLDSYPGEFFSTVGE